MTDNTNQPSLQRHKQELAVLLATNFFVAEDTSFLVAVLAETFLSTFNLLTPFVAHINPLFGIQKLLYNIYVKIRYKNTIEHQLTTQILKQTLLIQKNNLIEFFQDHIEL